MVLVEAGDGSDGTKGGGSGVDASPGETGGNGSAISITGWPSVTYAGGGGGGGGVIVPEKMRMLRSRRSYWWWTRWKSFPGCADSTHIGCAATANTGGGGGGGAESWPCVHLEM